MKFQSIKTSRLNKKQIDQILNLKNTHWKHGYESQLTWFKKNALLDDSHNLMLISNEIADNQPFRLYLGSPFSASNLRKRFI